MEYQSLITLDNKETWLTSHSVKEIKEKISNSHKFLELGALLLNLDHIISIEENTETNE
jgi:tmRNA-binding protein